MKPLKIETQNCRKSSPLTQDLHIDQPTTNNEEPMTNHGHLKPTAKKTKPSFAEVDTQSATLIIQRRYLLQQRTRDVNVYYSH